MDFFYIITNMLKDKDLQITNEIRSYIESRGKRCVLCRKDGMDTLSRAQFRMTLSADLYWEGTAR